MTKVCCKIYSLFELRCSCKRLISYVDDDYIKRYYRAKHSLYSHGSSLSFPQPPWSNERVRPTKNGWKTGNALSGEIALLSPFSRKLVKLIFPFLSLSLYLSLIFQTRNRGRGEISKCAAKNFFETLPRILSVNMSRET